MIKKIKLFNKIMKIVDLIDFDKVSEIIEKIKGIVPELSGILEDIKKLLKK